MFLCLFFYFYFLEWKRIGRLGATAYLFIGLNALIGVVAVSMPWSQDCISIRDVLESESFERF